MSHTLLEQEINFTPGGIMSKELHKTPNAHYTLMCMAKDTTLDTHTSTKNGVIIVLKGEGTFTLQDQKIPMKPNTLITFPAGAKHALNASENLAFLLCLSE